MSQPEKNKKNPFIAYMSKKRRFKEKFRNKANDNVTGYQANSNINNRREKDWFTDQYEKRIGKPLPRKEFSTDEVLRKLQESTKYRWVPEANTYKSFSPQPGNVHYIEWRNPMVKVCKCPDTECTCSGIIMLPRKKIPHAERYIKSPWIRKLVGRFRKPSPPPTESFIQRLAAVVGVEAAVYQDLERKGILNIRGAEFCMSRCIRYYGPGNMPTAKYFQDKQKFQSYETPFINENEEDDDRTCDSFYCTVSTQSTVGPTGELVIGDFSHELYSTLGEAIVRDLEGTELQLLSYKSSDDGSAHKSHNLCSFDKLLGIRELINIKGLKNQISQLKQNIYTSLFEIKEKSSLIGTSKKHYEESQENNDDSSEDITIPTPYKGVVLKAKKKPQENPAGNQPPHFSQTDEEIVRGTLPEQVKRKTSEINNVSSIPNILSLEKVVKEAPAAQQKIEAKTSDLDIENQKRKFSEECSISFVNSPICNIQPNETNECPSPLPIKSLDICEEIVKESLSAEKSVDSFKEIAGNTKNPKRSYKEIAESTDSRNFLNEILEMETRTKQTNNYFKKRVYGISIDQLQNINIKKFVKCVCDKNGVFIHRHKEKGNQKDLQVEGNKSIQRTHESKSEENLRENDSKTRSVQNLSVEEPKIKPQVIDAKLLGNYKMISNQNINTSNTANQVNCDKLPDNSSLSTNKEKIVNSDNTSILPSLQQTEVYNIENQSKNSKQCTLTNSSLKTYPNSKYNSNKSIVLSKGNESVQQFVHQNNKASCSADSKKKIEVTLGLENTIKSEVSKKAHLLTKKLSNLSSVFKRILRGKMHKSIKSLPEPTVHRNFRKSYQTQINMGEMERKTYIKNSKKKSGEPENSEREMFSIQYSAVSEIKCSSKFLKINERQSYPGEQQGQGVRGPVPEGIRRLTA